MSNIHANPIPGVRLELAFASVIPGKETQLFTEYFPKVSPIVASLGGTQVASFAVLESSADIDAPTLGALFQWPTVLAYLELHKNLDFLAVKHLRDDAVSQFWSGHFFAVETKTSASFDTSKIYAVIVAGSDVALGDVDLSLSLAADSTNKDYSGRELSIAEWSPTAQALLEAGSDKIDVFKVKFNPPKPTSNEEES